jgi:perosamine synthetase
MDICKYTYLQNLHKLFTSFIRYFHNPYFGFIQGHSNLSNENMLELKQLIGIDNQKILQTFEVQFAGLIGEGNSASFASGRMGFYVLMQVLGVGVGDEVVLQGATCSVMANAVLRIGAKPVYADIDPDTFGSSVTAIRRVISSRTKMIVAQHSFGIPCDIRPIVELSRTQDIFLLEDCALTLGSSVDGVVCGNFGDAALFSTDHSKPLNTLTGGLIYTKNTALFEKLKEVQSGSGLLSVEKQQALWRQLLFERKHSRPDRYGRMQLIETLLSKLRLNSHPFLDEDYGTKASTSYPYPAKLPTFLAALGLLEIQNWEKTVIVRKKQLSKALDIIGRYTNVEIPAVYQDPSRDIVPLRVALAPKNGEAIRNQLSQFICTSWTWFMQPIVAAKEPLERFGYMHGSCPISEKVGKKMVNLPCNISVKWAEVLQNELIREVNHEN